jgi:hypothetical protein
MKLVCDMQNTSRSGLEGSISLGLILFGLLIACSSNDLLVTGFGVSLLALGGALWLWGQR